MASSGEDYQTALQKHVSFFDRNNDGLVYPWETYQGFRSIGCGIALSISRGITTNLAFSRKTRPGKGFNLLFPIEVKNIHLAIPGSGTHTYDSQGRFVPEKFEEIFTKHAHKNPNALTSQELKEMLKANRDPKDYTGWLGAYLQWKTLYALCKDKDDLLQKDTIRAVYDRSLFERLEKERSSPLKK